MRVSSTQEISSISTSICNECSPKVGRRISFCIMPACKRSSLFWDLSLLGGLPEVVDFIEREAFDINAEVVQIRSFPKLDRSHIDLFRNRC